MTTSSPPTLRGFDVTLFLDVPTATHHDKKIVRLGNGRMMLADKPDLVRARKLYALHLAMSGRRPSSPLDGPISLEVTFVFAGKGGPWFTKKPDASNLIKTLEDCLVKSKWLACDQRVCRLVVQKTVGPKGFVRIVAREMGD